MDNPTQIQSNSILNHDWNPTHFTVGLSNDAYKCNDDNKTLFISIIVPIRNEAKYIEQTLAQLVAQAYDKKYYEIVVIDGQSTDGTQILVEQYQRRHKNIKLLCNPRKLSSSARNIGIKAARGDVMLIIDGHCEIDDPHLFDKTASAFLRSGADCLGRPQTQEIMVATPLQRAIAAARSSQLGHHPDSYVYSNRECFVPARSVAVAYRREVFDTVGYFDEAFDACEDVEFNYKIDKAGLRCFFTPEIAVKYHPRAALKGLFRQLMRYGRGRMQLFRKYRETFSLPTFIPLFFVLGLFLGLGSMWFSQWLAYGYMATLTIYSFIVLLVSIRISLKQDELVLLPLLPIVFFTIHIASGVGMLSEALSLSFVKLNKYRP